MFENSFDSRFGGLSEGFCCTGVDGIVKRAEWSHARLDIFKGARGKIKALYRITRGIHDREFNLGFCVTR